MIESLVVQGFQSHSSTYLEFSPGVNVILGPSDSGKTAIVRALCWLTWNRPSGKAFLSHWAGETLVKIVLAEGNAISRFRGRNDNSYLLNSLEFKAVQTDVPSEVKLLLNINETNVSTQLSRPFLLDSSPGEVAQHFNRIAHLDSIDVGLRNVQQWLRKIEQDITSGEHHLVELREELTKYEHLGELEGWVIELEQLESNRIKLTNDCKRLDNLLNDVADTENRLKEFDKIIRADETVSALIKSESERAKLASSCGRLGNLLNELFNIGHSIKELERTAEADEKVSALIKLEECRLGLKQQRDILYNLLNSIISTESSLTQTTIQLELLEDEFHEAFPSICPLCGQEVKK